MTWPIRIERTVSALRVHVGRRLVVTWFSAEEAQLREVLEAEGLTLADLGLEEEQRVGPERRGCGPNEAAHQAPVVYRDSER